MSELHVISLGAGVQSTTVLLMALHGEVTPLPAAAIFADTGWEPATVYRHLDWCEQQMAGRIPLYRVGSGQLREHVMSYARGESRQGYRIPAYLRNREGGEAMLRRQCTSRYKIEPIQRQVRALLDASSAERAVQWLGISLDEATRMKPSRVSFIRSRWPLIERRMTRHDCLLWLERHGYPRPPRSACIGCPYRSDTDWRELRADPMAWADAVEVDAAIRHVLDRAGEVFLHRSMRPLPLVDLSTPQERGQLGLWDRECEGMCGV